MNNSVYLYSMTGILLLISSLFVIPTFIQYLKKKNSFQYWFLYVYIVAFLLFLQLSIDGHYGFNDHLSSIYFNCIFLILIVLAFVIPNIILNINNKISKIKIFILTFYLFLFILYIIAF